MLLLSCLYRTKASEVTELHNRINLARYLIPVVEKTNLGISIMDVTTFWDEFHPEELMILLGSLLALD